MADETPPEGNGTEAGEVVAAAEGAEGTEVPALGEREQALLDRLAAELGDGVVEHAEACGDLVVRVRPDSWRRAASVARSELGCDYLSFVAGIDWMPAEPFRGAPGGEPSQPSQPSDTAYGAAGSAGRFQVFARVQSTTDHHGVTLKVDVDESDPRAESWVEVYPGADWHERECWEMYGISFDGHPNLRHIYLPSEFQGHPLRKDFPLLAREVKPWPGLVDVEGPAGSDEAEGGDA
ncbi:MAG: NADH-quinone oxidoreductase subunit C [Acidimicrobiia bacterium]|nr:NADH-quinone oxidoreductase subunit C [Acidimicrobiia bacterium]